MLSLPFPLYLYKEKLRPREEIFKGLFYLMGSAQWVVGDVSLQSLRKNGKLFFPTQVKWGGAVKEPFKVLDSYKESLASGLMSGGLQSSRGCRLAEELVYKGRKVSILCQIKQKRFKPAWDVLTGSEGVVKTMTGKIKSGLTFSNALKLLSKSIMFFFFFYWFLV